MLEVSFAKKVSNAPYGVQVRVQGTEGLFVALPERALCCRNVEEAVVIFLEAIEREMSFFAQMFMVDLSAEQIEQAICENMGLISAVYYHVHGSVLNKIRKECT